MGPLSKVPGPSSEPPQKCGIQGSAPVLLPHCSPSEAPYITGTGTGSPSPESTQSLGSQGLWASINGPSLRFDFGPIYRPQIGDIFREIFAWKLLLLQHHISRNIGSRFLGNDCTDVNSSLTYRPERAALLFGQPPCTIRPPNSRR